MSSQATCFSQGIPPILSCVLVHLASSESFAVAQDTSVWKSLKNDAFRFCTSTLGYMNPSNTCSKDNSGNIKRHSFQEFATLMLHPYQVLLISKFFFKNHKDEAKLKPLNYCMDFNYRSLSVFTAQRLLARFAELFSVSLNLIVIDLHNSRVFCVDDTIEKTFGALNSPQEIFTTCLSHCLDYLGSLSLKKERSRYCLMSIVGSLFNVLLTLITSSPFSENALDESSFLTLYSEDIYSEDKYLEQSVCLDRALLKSLLQKIIHLCVLGKHDQQNFQANELRSLTQHDSGYLDSDAQNNFGSLQTTKKELDQILRLRLYVAILQIFWLAKISFERETPTTLLLGVDIPQSTIDFFLKQLQKDLLFLEATPMTLLEKKTPLLTRSSQNMILCSNDVNLFSKLFPGLCTYPAESCVPVLKIFIEYRAAQTISDVFSTTNSLSESNLLTETQNECIAGHMLLPSSQWTLNSTTLQAIQLWIYHVFENFNGFNRNHCDQVMPLGIRKSSDSFLDNIFSECITRHSTLCTSTSVMCLALSLLHVLIKKPAICEALLASSIPVNPPVYMVTQAAVNNVPLASVCRTVLLAAPFLPRLNAPFSLKDFGFPTFAASNQDIGRITKLHDVLKETNVASSVILLSPYMFIIDNVLTKVKHLQVCLTVEMLDEDAQKTTTTVERASWYFFKWWLARDHQFSSCFSCYNQLVEDLKCVLKEDFFFKSEKPSTMTSSTYLLTTDTSHTYFANECLSTFLQNTNATKPRTQLKTLSFEEDSQIAAPQADLHSRFACADLLQKRLKNLCLILVLTSHSWLQLLTTVSDALLMQSQIKHVPLSANDRNSQESRIFRIPHDDVFLTLQFQSRTIQSAVLITQLSTFQNSLQMTSLKGPFHNDVSRTLLSPFSFKMSHLDIILPYIQQRQQFLVTTLQSVEREFLIVKLLLHQVPIEENKDQQIQEQIKRSLLERARSLVALLNATMLGLLVSVPLDCKNFQKTIKDIDAFLYLPRSKHQEQLEEKSKSYIFFEKHNALYQKQGSTVAFYVRILSLASGMLIKGLQMILDLEKIPIKLSNLPLKKTTTTSNRNRQNFYSANQIPNSIPLSSSNLTKAFKSALERIITTTDITLGSPIQSQALHLCGRLCATISKLEELPGFNGDDITVLSRAKPHTPIPLKLLQGSCKIVCTHSLTLNNLFMTIHD
ncbi:uncharacterized protein LOC128884256 [Hylaeus volcanicus]|uniref:uncharacterized protein LOC128884256 n=1 Tax=Hylaeus volcanicus TaxID=313075 RepID=UPI0023B80889|nr:uncharacterized protein LOC128884256 [Hylaeus volcanicus]